jgi:UDP-N-acetyl-D-glucosamine dehydrogenase
LLRSADLVVVLTDHTCYDYQWIAKNARLIFDTRNATKHVKGHGKKIEKL